MRKEIADKWVAALESGEYEQGKKTLRSIDGFCCLGVLCDLYQKEHVGCGWREAAQGNLFDDGYDSDTALLPVGVVEWAGMRTINASLSSPKFRHLKSLATMNDSGKSFKEIAAVIKENYNLL